MLTQDPGNQQRDICLYEARSGRSLVQCDPADKQHGQYKLIRDVIHFTGEFHSKTTANQKRDLRDTSLFIRFDLKHCNNLEKCSIFCSTWIDRKQKLFDDCGAWRMKNLPQPTFYK